ncbi:sugar transferase [Candidatus Pelagibacter bacterium nBUS_29]|uniref:sugar transferase n=1 Tax=Candidatus Pelagibacter bacterium nBUS_29 TaxID=3374190 RepID=UPI003EB6E30F
MYHTYFKRILDIISCLSLILIFFPIMIVIFILVWLKIGFPIFFHKRPGLNNKIFVLYKFKTLHDAPPGTPEKKRQSSLGDFLRKTGLDELPQLFNVIQNKMSLIGPRPLLVEYLDKYSVYEKKRHLVKPGITGLAQISPNKSGIKLWKKSIKLDLFYVSNVSFLLDIKILFETVKLVILKKKQYQDFNKFYE